MSTLFQEASRPAPSRSRDEFGLFVARELPALLRLGHFVTGSADAGGDLVQTALVSTLSAWPEVKQDDPFGYVRRSMINANVSAWRRWGSRVDYRHPPEGDASDPTANVADRLDLRRALATLPIRQRAVLVLRYFCDMSERDIAQRMGIRPGTVKSQAAKGLAALRRQLASPAPFPVPTSAESLPPMVDR
jgi:RNA polymerase sigma-70 factor (sigma-E family)